MATNTYVALDKQTLVSNTGPVTFSNIPQTYKHLRLVVSGGFVDSGFMVGARVGNGSLDTGQNYSYTVLRSSTSSPSSYRKTNMIFGALCQQGGNNLNNVMTVDFLNYSKTDINKTWIARYGNAGEGVDLSTSLWRSNAAINTISIAECGDGGNGTWNYGNMLSGTTFTLYGIYAEGITPAPKATGGAIYSDSLYYYHVFGSTGVFTPNTSLTCDYIAIGGGGGAGSYSAPGGGGAGGLRSTLTATGGGGALESAISLGSGTPYTITVGAGGTGAINTTLPTNGGPSSIAGSGLTTITSAGGGYGGGYSSGHYSANSGGSGGGANYNPGTNTGGAASPSGQGYAGGNGVGGPSGSSGGGGGGAGAVGVSGTQNPGGAGGNGGVGLLITAFSATTGTGLDGYYAGGGGGGSYDGVRSGTGGLGGGGNAAYGTGNGVSGIANTGSGGGSGWTTNAPPNNASGGNGGSGLIILRYLKA